jgi:SAM-dependent methyltransferase
MTLSEKFYPEVGVGGFTRRDGTVQFYTQVNALLRPEFSVVDFGAGRGAFAEQYDFRSGLATLKGKVAEVIGVDVDDAVLENSLVDRAVVYSGDKIPLADQGTDLILADMTFEHIPDPATTSAELSRILKPGGWICARTPHLRSLIALGSSLIPNRFHAGALKSIQPGRQERDVFPALYRLNSKAALRRYFAPGAWIDRSYTWTPEPAYHLGSPAIFQGMRALNYLKEPILGGEVLLVFLQKRPA